MKCKYCHAKGIKISHFMRAHKALMLRKMRRGKRGGRRKSGGRAHRGGGKSSTLGTGGYSKVTLTFHD